MALRSFIHLFEPAHFGFAGFSLGHVLCYLEMKGLTGDVPVGQSKM